VQALSRNGIIVSAVHNQWIVDRGSSKIDVC
jgi:hypothetical protein